jgi:hypothetical protein
MPELYDLEKIHIESGVSAFDNQPFCQVTCRSKEGHLLSGQLDPMTCRALALQWLEVAEAADHDAAVMHLLREKAGLDDEAAALFIAELRNFRSESQE